MKKIIAAAGLGAALIAAPLTAAGTASASCVSLNGHGAGDGPGVGGGCESDPGSLSIGLGKDTRVHTDGVGNVGIAIGNPGQNPVYGYQPTQAYAGGESGNFSLALGKGTNAGSMGTRNTAVAVGPG